MRSKLLYLISVMITFGSIGYLNAQEQEGKMKIIAINPLTEMGPSKEAVVLFKGPKRTIVQITLRNSGVLASHSASEPITIQCLTGKGRLTVGVEKTKVELQPNILVTIEPNIIHEILGEPAVSVLLTKFTQD